MRPPEARREAWNRRLSLTALKSNQFCWHLDFAHLRSSTVRKCLWFTSLVLCDGSLRRQIHSSNVGLACHDPTLVSPELSSSCPGGQQDDNTVTMTRKTYRFCFQVCGPREVVGSAESQLPKPSQSFQPGSFASRTSLSQKYRRYHTHFHPCHLHSHLQNCSFALVYNICHSDIPDSHGGRNLENRK